MNLFDMHCDTIYRLYFENKKNEGLAKNSFQVDLEKLKAVGALGQFFAIFYDSADKKELPDNITPWELFRDMEKLYSKEMDLNSNLIKRVFSYEDIIHNQKNNLLSSILTIEGGESIMGDSNKLKEAYNLGVRLITLTWNNENEFGYPNKEAKFRGLGLKEKGLELISLMNELGIIIDVSHLSDGGFWDVIKHSSKPFVASHSNARGLCNHPRNLTDEMIKALADKGGITGLNFASGFLDGSNLCKIDDLVRHSKYLIDKGGEDFLALGTDYDGIGNDLEIKNISEMKKLDDALRKGGLTNSQLEKIYYKNTLRVLKDTI